jgi:histidinol-phosphate aminotransferase
VWATACVPETSQVAAIEALRHQDEVIERRRSNAELRSYMVERLAAMGRGTVPSEANFVLVDVEDLCPPDVGVCQRLMELGAIVRDGAKIGCPGWARVSVGTRAEIDFFLDKLSALGAGG